ncbi:MAG TPA: hypothetical protein H9673_06450 [Candidatus Adamsella sp.]|nr:hypothetical protein [Candidatus Adamsella sp.]
MSVNLIYSLIERMENTLTGAIKLLPLPYAITNVDQLLDLLDKVRVGLPQEIQEARDVLQRKEEMLTEAQNKADNIIYQAQVVANKMIAESEILKAVQMEAERIKKEVVDDCTAMKKQAQEDIERARTNSMNEAIMIKEGAEKYAESVLNNLGNDVEQLNEIIKNAQRQLSKMKAEPLTQQMNVQNVPSERR